MTCVATGTAYVVPAVVGLKVQAFRLRRRRHAAVSASPRPEPVAAVTGGR